MPAAPARLIFMRPDREGTARLAAAPSEKTGSMFKRVLIANRGEASVRISRALADLGVGSVAVYCGEDQASLHVARADASVLLPGAGPAAYLAIDAVIQAALQSGCDAIHPGYGFLSENAAFARACAAAGLTFIGPSPETLDLFGDKAAARDLAGRTGIPLARGTSGSTTLADARVFMAEIGNRPVMVKALAGGGGRGMRVVERADDLDEAFQRAASEAKAAFGADALYVEELIRPARHIEVQVAGDTGGQVIHLHERECSLQRRHQKLVEIAPAPGLEPSLRDAICEAALVLARAASVTTLTTVEFLVDEASGRFVFMEANPRLQVEHTVTEEVTGVDLVQTQIRLAAGASLTELGLSQAAVRVRGMAVQVRVNMERVASDGSALPTGGTLQAFDPPGGTGLRVETFGYAGYRTTTSFDSLLAKVIATAPSGRWDDARARIYRALGEFRIAGVETNRSFLQNILCDTDVIAGRFDTGLVERKAAALAAPRAHADRFAAAASGDGDMVADLATTGPDGTEPVASPTGGRIVSIDVAEGDAVAIGAPIAVVEAMKMEHRVTSTLSGIVRKVVRSAGDAITASDALVFIEPSHVDQTHGQVVDNEGSDPRPALAEFRAKRAALQDDHRKTAVEKQHARGALTARERIAQLCDAATFQEFGGLIRNEKVTRDAPADGVITGAARIGGRHVMVISQDFTVFGGSSGHLGGDKMERAARMARMQGIPVVMLLDGGGHRIQDGQSSRAYAAAVTIFHEFARMSGWVPIVSAVLGAGFAANTNYSSMADFVVMVKGRSTMGLAGPALVKAGTGEITTAEALGGTAVQVDRQGLADLGVNTEADAFDAIRRFLAFLPSNAGQAPPALPASGGAVNGQKLEALVPANTRQSYDMHDVLAAIADPASLFELKPTFARSLITSFGRLDGRAVGFLANQPLVRAGMLDADACEKAAHFIALCDAFGLPLIYLVDIPGLSIGSSAERTTLGRRSAKMLFELGHATVPRISVILRKGYGLGYLAMAGGRSFDADACFAWPSAEICAMSVEGSVDVAYRQDYERAADPAARRHELIDAIRAEISPIKAAEGFGIDDLIEPSETRARLIEVLARTPPRRQRDMPPKHRAIPPI